MNGNRTQANGFTLIEVLFATAVAATLLGAIVLNLGVRGALLSASQVEDPLNHLSERITEIVHSSTLAELEDMIGVSASQNPLSDPEGTDNRKLVSIGTLELGGSSSPATVLAINIKAGPATLTRWLSPLDFN